MGLHHARVQCEPPCPRVTGVEKVVEEVECGAARSRPERDTQLAVQRHPAALRPPPRPLTRTPWPKYSIITAAVRRVADPRAATALRAAPLVVPSSRARSCHRARCDITA
eukprot:6139371-Prymnesium_polylepis.2